MVLTNTVLQKTEYSKHTHVNCMTITELVESLKDEYSGLSDHLNLASIENNASPIIQDREIPADHVNDICRND